MLQPPIENFAWLRVGQSRIYCDRITLKCYEKSHHHCQQNLRQSNIIAITGCLQAQHNNPLSSPHSVAPSTVKKYTTPDAPSDWPKRLAKAVLICFTMATATNTWCVWTSHGTECPITSEWSGIVHNFPTTYCTFCNSVRNHIIFHVHNQWLDEILHQRHV